MIEDLTDRQITDAQPSDADRAKVVAALSRPPKKWTDDERELVQRFGKIVIKPLLVKFDERTKAEEKMVDAFGGLLAFELFNALVKCSGVDGFSVDEDELFAKFAVSCFMDILGFDIMGYEEAA